MTREGTPADYANYPLLCQALKSAFEAAGHSEWLITVATSINPEKLAQGYDMAAMHPHISWFNMMSYDIYGAFSSVLGANADMSYISNTMDYVFGLNVPREKLVLGLAAYGRSMRISNPSCNYAGCPFNGAGLTGCHGEAGNLPFFQIKETYLDNPGSYDSLTLNQQTGSMELVTGGNLYFTSFDNEETFNIKYQYAFAQCLRGIMWWAVDLIKEPIAFAQTAMPTPKPTTAKPTVSLAPSLKPSVSYAPTLTRKPTAQPTAQPTPNPTTPRY